MKVWQKQHNRRQRNNEQPNLARARDAILKFTQDHSRNEEEISTRKGKLKHKTRKEERKEARQKKKARKNAFHMRVKQKNVGLIIHSQNFFLA